MRLNGKLQVSKIDNYDTRPYRLYIILMESVVMSVNSFITRFAIGLATAVSLGTGAHALSTCHDNDVANAPLHFDFNGGPYSFSEVQLDNADQCVFGTAPNGTAADLNRDKLFGLDNWEAITTNTTDGSPTAPEFAAKQFKDQNHTNIDFAFNTALLDSFDKIVVVATVVEDALSDTGPQTRNYAAALVSGILPGKGSWSSPWVSAVRNKGASYDIRFYGAKSASVAEVPVPAAGLLLITGIGALAFARRRKSA